MEKAATPRQTAQDAPGSRRRGGRPRLGEADKTPTQDELAAILRALARPAIAERRRGVIRGPRSRDELLVELLALTGLRAAEVCRLLVRDVHLARRSSYLRVRGGKKRDRRDVDTIPLPWDLVPALERWCAGQPADAPLFSASTSSRRLDRREVWRIVKRGMRHAGVRSMLNAHSLRHYFVTAVARTSRSAAVVAQLARLRSLAQASIYVHLSAEEGAAVTGPLRAPGRRARKAR